VNDELAVVTSEMEQNWDSTPGREDCGHAVSARLLSRLVAPALPVSLCTRPNRASSVSALEPALRHTPRPRLRADPGRGGKASSGE